MVSHEGPPIVTGPDQLCLAALATNMWNIDLKPKPTHRQYNFPRGRVEHRREGDGPSTLLGPEGSVARNTSPADRRDTPSEYESETARTLRTSQWTRASL